MRHFGYSSPPNEGFSSNHNIIAQPKSDWEYNHKSIIQLYVNSKSASLEYFEKNIFTLPSPNHSLVYKAYAVQGEHHQTTPNLFLFPRILPTVKLIFSRNFFPEVLGVCFQGNWREDFIETVNVAVSREENLIFLLNLYLYQAYLLQNLFERNTKRMIILKVFNKEDCRECIWPNQTSASLYAIYSFCNCETLSHFTQQIAVVPFFGAW